jgi:hypothetical protein
MRLSVWIRETDALAQPNILGLIRAAPIHIEGKGKERAYVATFGNLPMSLDLAVRLISEVSQLQNVRVTMNDRAVANLNKFWSALLCYGDSLTEPDPEAYCAQRAARVGDADGCPDQKCMSHCQFLCTRCFQVAREKGMPPVAEQLRAIAVQAEVEWCPNLRLSVTRTRL